MLKSGLSSQSGGGSDVELREVSLLDLEGEVSELRVEGMELELDWLSGFGGGLDEEGGGPGSCLGLCSCTVA